MARIMIQFSAGSAGILAKFELKRNIPELHNKGLVEGMLPHIAEVETDTA